MKSQINAGIVREVIEGVSSLIEEGIINLDPNGLHFISADRALVCVVSFEIPSSSFDSYELKDNLELGLNLNNLLTILKRAKFKVNKILLFKRRKMEFQSTIMFSALILISTLSIVSVRASEFNNVAEFGNEYPILPELARVSININSDIRAVGASGYTLSDFLCKNGEFSIQSSNKVGEWVFLGGWLNTPPIYFVDNLQDIVTLIKRWEGQINYTSSEHIKLYDGYVDNKTGIPVYALHFQNGFYYQGGYDIMGYGNLICQVTPKTYKVEGADQISKNSFVVTASDTVNVDIKNDVNCIFFRFANGGLIRRGIFYPSLGRCTLVCHAIDPLCRASYRDCSNTLYPGSLIGSVNFVKSFTVKNPQPSEIEASPVALDSQFSYGRPSYITINVKNGGDTGITITDGALNTISSLISCYPSSLSPGETAQCVFYVVPTESASLTADIKYNFNQCGSREFETKSIFIGMLNVQQAQCTIDSDCNTGFTCCYGTCYKRTEGMCKDINGDGIPDWIPYAK